MRISDWSSDVCSSDLLLKVPRELRFLVRDDISAFMKWLVEDASFGLFTFTELTRSIAWVLEQPYDLARALLVNGFVQGVGAEAAQWLPPLSWIAVVFVVAAIGHYAKSIGLADRKSTRLNSSH